MDKKQAQIEKNRAYNRERKYQAELMKRDLNREKFLESLYQTGYDRIQNQIDTFYMRYANQNGLSKTEAMKIANEMDVTKFNEKAAKAVQEKDFSPDTNRWLKIYNLKMKVSRLELLKAELALEMQSMHAEMSDVFDKERFDELVREYKKQSGILGMSTRSLPRTYQAILAADFYGQNFSSRVWGKNGLHDAMQKEVFASLNRIYTDMMGFKQERKHLMKRFGVSQNEADRLLKTEIGRINSDTDKKFYNEHDFTHVIYVAEPGACHICAPLNNKAIPIDEIEQGVNYPLMHPNCRCSTYGHIKMEYKVGGSTLDEYDLYE